MKVLMNTLNFSGSQIQNKDISKFRSYSLESNSVDTISFKGLAFDKEVLKKMLDSADNGILREATAIRKKGNVGFLSELIDIGKRLISGDNSKHTNFVIQNYCNTLGMSTFIKSNKDFFNRIVAYAEENSIPADRFKEEIHYAGNSAVDQNDPAIRELCLLTTNSRNNFINIGKENGKIQFLRKQEVRKFLNQVYAIMTSGKGKEPVVKEVVPKPVIAKPIVEKTPSVVKQQETTDYEALLKEFYEKGRQQKDPSTLKTEEEKRIWMEEDEELRKMYNKLRENNISFVIKEEFNPDPNIDRDKKKNYFYSWKVGHANANEASKLDFLEMYEKYGERYYDPPRQLNSAIAHLAIATDEPTSDKILNKYIHIIDRIAIKDPDGLNDAVWVAGAFERNAEIMSEDTLLKFIDVLKRISYQQQEFCTAKYAIGNTVHKDSPRVKAALEDFEKSVQDLPYLIK